VVNHFPALSEATALSTPQILAAYTLCCGLLAEKLAIHSSLTKRTLADFIGKLPEQLQLALVSSAVYHLHNIT
jgi:hypothetical protein